MTSFFDRGGIPPISSLTAGPISLGRRLSMKNIPQIAMDFKKMVSELPNDANPYKCIEFFLKNFGKKSEKEIKSCDVSSELSRIIRHIPKNWQSLSEKEKTIGKLSEFLNIAINVCKLNSKTVLSIFHVMIAFLSTKNDAIIRASICFIQCIFKRNELCDFILSGNQLIAVWASCFVDDPDSYEFVNEAPYSYIAPILTAAAEKFNITEIDKIQDFMNTVLNDLQAGKIKSHNLPLSMMFVGYVTRNVDTGAFIPDILYYICQENADLVNNAETWDFFEPFLNAKIQDIGNVWAALDSICANDASNTIHIQSALNAIYKSGALPTSVEDFKFDTFAQCYLQLEEQYQVLLFTILKNTNVEIKADFLQSVMPLNQTLIDTNYLLDMIQGVQFGDLIDQVVNSFIVNCSSKDFDDCLNLDESYQKIVEILILQLPSDSPMIKQTIEKIIEVIDQFDDLTAVHLLSSLLMNADPSTYMSSLIEVVKNGVNEGVLKAMTEASRKSATFNDIFLETNGVEIIGLITQSIPGLDLLAAIVSDGPYDQIDKYIYDNFKKIALSKYDEKVLQKLMMGLPQDSNKAGFLRIPSLCAFVKTASLSTPFDQYIFAAKATKFFKPTTDQILRCASRYMDTKTALKLCEDSESLPILTDTIFPHNIVYQFHPSARFCSMEYQRANCCSIWFSIADISGKTVLITFPGGNLSIEANGYITFGTSSKYCTLKEWHLFTFVTIEKNGQKIISGYFDGIKMSDIITTDVMTITIGHDVQSECNALWFVSPFLHSSDIILEESSLLEIYKEGPYKPTNKLMHSSKGAKLVPYQGILRYMHLFGGPYFIFNLMLKMKTNEEFMFLIQAAFNLLTLKAFRADDFYSSLHYILRRKIELFNQQTEQIILNELATSKGFNWNALFSIMGDALMVSSHYISCHLLTDILTMNKITPEAVSMFHLFLDAFVFINCDDETNKNLLNSCKTFIKFDKTLLKKVALTMISIPFCDTDSPKETFYDERFINKQKCLFNILTEDPTIFSSTISFSEALSFAVKLHDELCIDMLEFLATLCFPRSSDTESKHGKDNKKSKNAYFDYIAFKKILPHLYSLVRYEKFWNVLFMFLTNKKADSIEEYSPLPIARVELFHELFDLVSGLLPFELEDSVMDDTANIKEEEKISFRVLHAVLILIATQNISLADMVDYIQNLCSLGYGEKTSGNYPFQPKGKISITRRLSRQIPIFKRQSYNSEYELIDSSVNDIFESFGSKMISFLDTKLSNSTLSHMNRNPVQLGQFMEIPILEPRIDIKLLVIDELFQKNPSIIECISKIASRCLIDLCKDPAKFKKGLIPLLIFGNDVPNKVAIAMHRKNVFTIIAERKNIPNDLFYYFIDFLTYRVFEGWWSEQILDLFNSLVFSVNTKCSSISKFVIICLSLLKDAKEVKSLATVFMETQVFKFCIENTSFLHSFIYLLTTPDVLAIPDKGFYELLAGFSNMPEFKVAVKGGVDNINQYISDNSYIAAGYNDFYKTFETSAANNTTDVIDERKILTRSVRNPKLINFESNNIIQATYIRRAFRYEFFWRVNHGITVIEPSINSIFSANNIVEKCKDPPEKFAIISNPHPLIAPTRLVPLLYPYDSKYEKVEALFDVPVSEFQNDIPACSPELNAIHSAPKCLEGWALPGHYSAGATELFKQIFQGVNEPFNCSLLSAPEPLKCVGLFSKDSLHILMNATLDTTQTEGKVISLIEKSMISHYPLFENAMQGLMGDSSLFVGHVVLNIPFKLVTIVIPRKYCYKPIAFDIYTANGCHFTFVADEETRNVMMSKFKSGFNRITRRGYGFSQRLLSLKIDSVTNFWANGLMSNFDYLLYLNAISGRSFNDFSQYPVFPWIISDYNSETDPTSFRDLTKPMGQQTEERAEKFEIMFHESESHYYYGTHYSFPGAILYFLWRSEPNTLFNVMLHGGFDHPDRVFLSFEESWKASSEMNPQDVKELVPEFYCFPGVLQNTNHNSYPSRTDGTKIENAILPKWAHENPYLFIYKMRKALESSQITTFLPMWIDLIFGYKQRGDAAIEAKNVFTPLSYDDAKLDPTLEEAENTVINNFGQCPGQLFTSPHTIRNPANLIEDSQESIKMISESDVKVAKLKKLPSEIRQIKVYDEEIYTTPLFTHHMGASHFLVAVEDGLLNVKGKCQSAEPVFNITSTSISSDSFYLTITTECGIILNYWLGNDELLTLISRSLKPGTCFHTSAISSHFSVVLAASKHHVYMFDLTSGFLLREMKTKKQVKFIAFNEVNDFIVLCEETTIHVLRLDFTVFTTINCEDTITSLSTCDTVVWVESPIFVTGHISGSVYGWRVDFEDKKIAMFGLGKVLDKPIVAIELFQSYKAIICTDDNGNAVSISVKKIQRRFLKTSCYEQCTLCGHPLISTTTCTCSICGLPFCKQCAITGNANPICKGCEMLVVSNGAPMKSIGSIKDDSVQISDDI